MWNEVSCKIIYAENSVYMYSIWFRKNTGYMYIVILLVGFDSLNSSKNFKIWIRKTDFKQTYQIKSNQITLSPLPGKLWRDNTSVMDRNIK